MFIRLVVPVVLLSLCVVVHAMVLASMLGRLSRSARPKVLSFWHSMWILIRVAAPMLSAHLVEIGIWAGLLRPA